MLRGVMVARSVFGSPNLIELRLSQSIQRCDMGRPPCAVCAERATRLRLVRWRPPAWPMSGHRRGVAPAEMRAAAS